MLRNTSALQEKKNTDTKYVFSQQSVFMWGKQLGNHLMLPASQSWSTNYTCILLERSLFVVHQASHRPWEVVFIQRGGICLHVQRSWLRQNSPEAAVTETVGHVRKCPWWRDSNTKQPRFNSSQKSRLLSLSERLSWFPVRLELVLRFPVTQLPAVSHRASASWLRSEGDRLVLKHLKHPDAVTLMDM